MTDQELLQEYVDKLNALSDEYGYKPVAILQQIASDPVTVQATISIVKVENGERIKSN